MKINSRGFKKKRKEEKKKQIALCVEIEGQGIPRICAAFQTAWQWSLIFGIEIKQLHGCIVWAAHRVSLFPQSTLTPGLLADSGYCHTVTKKRGIQTPMWFRGLGDIKGE